MSFPDKPQSFQSSTTGSIMDEVPCSKAPSLRSRQTGVALFTLTIQFFSQLDQTSTSLNLSVPIHIDGLLPEKIALYREPQLSAECVRCFLDVFSVSKVREWWLTIFDWLDIWFLHETYLCILFSFCIFTLRSLLLSLMLLNVWYNSVTLEFIFIQIYIFFVSFFPFFQIPLC